VPKSTAECERAFSLMNTIISPTRNRLQIDHAGSVMFISIIGPPIHIFNPEKYVKNWLRRGNHAASDRQSVKRQIPDASSDYYAHVYQIL
jgi:hypothetical protein